jgi:hypothetical protein
MEAADCSWFVTLSSTFEGKTNTATLQSQIFIEIKKFLSRQIVALFARLTCVCPVLIGCHAEAGSQSSHTSLKVLQIVRQLIELPRARALIHHNQGSLPQST